MIKFVTVVSALTIALPSIASAQDPFGSTRLEIDREDLTRLADQYDAVSQSAAYSEGLRDEGRRLATMIRERLRVGDFRIGDQIALLVEGGETSRWDTLVVEAGPLIDVPTLGPVVLDGVLRSELESHLVTELGRYIQSPRVQAGALIRVTVIGVTQPGFHTLRSNLPLSEAVMLAGGPEPGSDPGEIRIERGREVLWSVEELVGPVAEGLTLDDLGLQAGDRIVLPGSNANSGLQGVLRATALMVVPVLVSTLIR